MNSTHDKCKLVVFSNKAWNAIVNETFRKDPVETGGILLGHILSNGYWIVMEAIPPGLSAIHQKAYFEYDTDFVNYLANSVAKQYKMDLSVLGLWHRHPGSMDVFSGTDDGTNATFAQMNEYGAISGLVNIDPKLRFTLRHVACPLHYQIVDMEVGDDLIPPQYFELKYSYGDDLRPLVPTGNGESPKTRIAKPERGGDNPSQDTADNNKQETDENSKDESKSSLRKYYKFLLLAIIPFFFLFFGIKIGYKLGDDAVNPSQSESKYNEIIAAKNDAISALEQQIVELQQVNDGLKSKVDSFGNVVTDLNNQNKNLNNQISNLKKSKKKTDNNIESKQEPEPAENE